MDISLDVTEKNGTPVTETKIFKSEAIMFGSIMSNGGSGTNLNYQEYENFIPALNSYVVSQTPSQIDDLIYPYKDFGYVSGSSGTEILSGGKKIIQITAISLGSTGTVTINGGDAIPLPYDASVNASSSITIKPDNLIDPTIVFTDTDSYYIEYQD